MGDVARRCISTAVILLVGVQACLTDTGSCPSPQGTGSDPPPQGEQPQGDQPCGVQPWHVAYGDTDPRLHIQRNGEAATIIDISTPLQAATPLWEAAGGLGEEFRVVAQKMDEGDACNESRIKCSVHTGTHVDAPGHFVNAAFKEGRGAESLNLYALNGPAHVVEVPSSGNITAEDLSRVAMPEGVRRLILKTKNTEWELLSKTPFEPRYVGIMPDAAQWLLDNTAVRLVGIDYLSIGPFGEPDQTKTHQTLLGKGVVVVEGLVLGQVEAGEYTLHCLPLKLVGSEGSPTRCILMK